MNQLDRYSGRMGWAEPEFSKKRVRRAGELIGGGEGSPAEVREARAIISNFRSSHGYPLLSVTVHVREKALLVDPDAVTARRQKRLPTILDKLERHPNMNVTSMHDLGGCRVVFGEVSQVHELVERLNSSTRARNAIVRTYDYIRGPQPSGYRGVHLVYEYRASKVPYQGLKIEVQIRTELQHSWATAVETMDLFGGTRLKYGEGPEELKRFFAVASALMAKEEQTEPVPDVGQDSESLRQELAILDRRLRMLERLVGYSAVVSQLPSSDRRSTIMLRLFRRSGQLAVSVFETQTAAEIALESVEQSDDEDVDAVLINITKIEQLQSAYPNYFANTSEFVNFVERQIEHLGASSHSPN